MLIDAGGGDVYRGAGLGKLLANLAAVGYRPEQIDAVLLTHFHPDHTGGVLLNGKVAFPNADIYIHKTDYDLLFGGTDEKTKAMVADITKILTPYKEAGRIKTFDKQEELFPGITAVPTPGHTPGHTCYQITNGRQTFFALGDIVHVADIQFKDPSVAIVFDADPAMAIETRKKLFASLAQTDYLIGGAHLSFPGLGYINHLEGGKYEFIAASYSTGEEKLLFP